MGKGGRRGEEGGKLTAEVSSDFVRNYRPLVEHFQRKFGVEMTFQGGGRGAAAANRVIAEAGAGLYNVDYFGQGDHLGGIAGPEFLRRLVLETKLTMVADRETALDWLITGKKGIMFLIGDLATPIREAKKFGAPVDRLTKDLQEGAVIAGGGGGVMLQAPKKAAHPNAGSIHQLDTVQRGPAHVAACESGQRFAARRYS